MKVDIWLFCEIGQRSQRLFKLKIPNYIQRRTTTFLCSCCEKYRKVFLSLVFFNKESSATLK